MAEERKFQENWLKDAIKEVEPVEGAGVALSIFHENKFLATYTSGFADRQKQKPVDEDTLFFIGSVTKGMVGFHLAALEKKGSISLDQPVNSDRTIVDLLDDEVESKIIPLDILSQRSGLPSHDLLWVLSDFDREAVLKKLKHLDHRPDGYGNSFIYNNLLYLSLSKLYEMKLNSQWFDSLNSDLFTPIEMRNSSPEFSHYQNAGNRAEPYFQDRAIPVFDAEIVGPAGAIISNVSDMKNWLRFVVTRADSSERVFDCHNKVEAPEGFVGHGLGWFGKEICYGLGWFMGQILGKKIVFGPGNIDGFSSLVIFVPDDKFGAVLLTNQSISPFPGRLAQKIFSKWYGVDLPDSFEIPTPPQPQPSDVEPQELSLFTGTYDHPAYGHLKIKRDGAKLKVQLFDHTWLANHTAENTFGFTMELFGGMPLPMSVVFDPESRIARMPLQLDPKTQPVEFQKMD